MPATENSNRRRSERVMLQVPITVRTDTLDGKKIEEATHTLVVNAHGGLMKLKAELLVGQPIRLQNPQTRAEESCRVVRVDESGADHFAVAFEFDKPAPRFWPIVFPPNDWSLSAQ